MVAGFWNECPYYALIGRKMVKQVRRLTVEAASAAIARWSGLLLALHRFEELGIGFRVLHFVK